MTVEKSPFISAAVGLIFRGNMPMQQLGEPLRIPLAPGDGGPVTISYAVHFQAPSSAMPKFGSAGRFEQMLAAAKTLPDGRLQFLKTERPAADMVRFAIDASATYLLATPK